MKQKQNNRTWPWKMVSMDDAEAVFIFDKLGCRIASMNPTHGYEVAKQDARIMAAAPLLLHELRHVVETWTFARANGVLCYADTMDNVISNAAGTLNDLII